LLIAKGELPPEALAAAKAIIDNSPQEFIRVTHGLGINQQLSFIPEFCEIREVSI
jgi:hypothetical protein